jgi:ankyrin repeat protein
MALLYPLSSTRVLCACLPACFGFCKSHTVMPCHYQPNTQIYTKYTSPRTTKHLEWSTGKYQIHKRPVGGPPASSEDDGLCLSKKNCNESHQDAKVLSCSHCGSKEWNILGDSDTGYVLTEGADGKKLCLVRQGARATLASCESEDVAYTPLQLQFASESDIKAMSSPAARLMGAASDGDKKIVAQLLKEGTNVNVRDWDELTALIPASSSGHFEIVKFLLKEGADVNAADKDGITALMEASIMGHTKVVDLLLTSGATVDETAKSGVTALWLAAGEGKTEVMTKLLAKGADPSNVRADGITALMTASVGGRCDAVKLLLENGADPTIADADGLTPLMNAAENGTIACMEALVAKADKDYINSFSKTGFSALIIAAAHGKKEAVEFLIAAGADVNAVHEDNRVTALMYAAAAGHIEVMKVLLANAADLHALHSNGGTALLEAATGGEPDAMAVLLEAGATHNFVDSDGVTPLMAVASQGNIKGLQLIVEYLKKDLSAEDFKTHINMASYSGGTSLMFAAAGGHAEATKQLIDLGADINAIARATPKYLEKLKKQIEEGTVENNDGPHIDGVTAATVAAQGGHLECIKLLIAAGADVKIEDDEKRTPLQLAIKGNYGEVALELVRAGANPNTPYVDDDGETHNLLMDAIMVENVEFAKLLIVNGADLSHKDEQKVSTLLQASHRGLADVVKLLLEKHGDKPGYLDDASDEGITPLISAASEGHTEVVQMLVDTKKVDVNGKDKDGTNALMAASARGHNKVVEVLLKAGAAVNEQNSDGHTALMFAYNGKNQVETLWERYSQYAGGEEKDDAGTGPLIQEALVNHTALVSLLLKGGADASLKDKEGHTAKDFDFHPDADADVLEKETKAEKVRDASKNEL